MNGLYRMTKMEEIKGFLKALFSFTALLAVASICFLIVWFVVWLLIYGLAYIL